MFQLDAGLVLSGPSITGSRTWANPAQAESTMEAYRYAASEVRSSSVVVRQIDGLGDNAS
jgi:hypothetical protein